MGKPLRNCRYCDAEISMDGIGLNKKLFQPSSQRGLFVCLSCMASILECTLDDLNDKIAAFKSDGCKLFV
jgi:hypothetical protein